MKPRSTRRLPRTRTSRSKHEWLRDHRDLRGDLSWPSWRSFV